MRIKLTDQQHTSILESPQTWQRVGLPEPSNLAYHKHLCRYITNDLHADNMETQSTRMQHTQIIEKTEKQKIKINKFINKLSTNTKKCYISFSFFLLSTIHLVSQRIKTKVFNKKVKTRTKGE